MKERPDADSGEGDARANESGDEKLGSRAALHQMQDVDVRRRDLGLRQVLANSSLTLDVEPDTLAGCRGKEDEACQGCR